MPRRSLIAKLSTPLALVALAVAAGPAGAATIGNTTLPPAATMPTSGCTTSQSTELVPYSTDSSYDYAVPAGGGSLTSWSFNTAGAKAGTPYSLLVVRPSGSSYQIIATDPETVPADAPPVATFTLTQPITVQAGDLIGAVVTAKSSVGCLFKGGSIPSAEVEGFGLGSSANGTVFHLTKTIPNELVNVSATVTQSNDIAISQTAEPTKVMQGDDGVFLLSVSNSGPSQTPVTVTDTLPSGMTPVSASAGTDPCSISGQTITCQVSGAPASIAVVASADSTGTLTNTATATGNLPDPNPANNTSTSTLKVAAMPDALASSSENSALADFDAPQFSLVAAPAPAGGAFSI
jgi:uncharacterized repeat protein (TIGR01451 family)